MPESVQYSQALVQGLEDSLKAACNQPYLRLTRPRKLGAAFLVQLENGSRPAQLDDRSEQQVIEILTSDRRASTLFLGFEARFVLATPPKHSLEHSSISVFHDILGQLTPLFRAEWDQLDASSASSKHAQPHWHFVQNPARIEAIVRETLTRSTGEVTEFGSEQESELFSGLVDCGHLHFAMTSFGKQATIKKLFGSEDFRDWFDCLTGYIADEIAYLVSKMPVASTPRARAFQPD